MLEDQADKKDSWSKNNVRMWGKRNYGSDDDEGDKNYVSYDWLEEDPVDTQRIYDKRGSGSPSSGTGMGHVIQHGSRDPTRLG